MSDICLSYVSPRPLQTLHWACQMEQMTNLRRLAFSGWRSREGPISNQFPKMQSVRRGPCTHQSESESVEKSPQIKEAAVLVAVPPCLPFFTGCKWGNTCGNSNVTITLLQITVSCQRLWSCRFPQANCKTF